MKIHGYCTGCRKVKRVNVSGSALASLAAGGVAQGTCDDCASPPPTNPALLRINQARRGRPW